MPTFLALVSFTDQGIKNIHGSIERAEQFRSEVESVGGKVKDIYWAIGEVDGVVIFDAPDGGTAATLLLHLASEGFVRTRCLRVFGADEFKGIITKA
jgi:uncharacterized protein with GYD domain